MNDYEIFKNILELCEVLYMEEKDTSGYPFWLSSRRRAETHFHVRFSANGVFHDFNVGYDLNYCRCPRRGQKENEETV